ncbi:hypothetical protein EVAR_13395_1 [Eumeta japonica]|uniref:Uncharacterized protein n=1 Tax=Eumeta variegata TaxID=151549 RepID=A0A4C1TSI3_EUMVA|nr:hypothetical protein EVAR_13395_1 [Eumeta japonica]
MTSGKAAILSYHSCTPTATCEARAAINKSNIEMLSIILPTHCKNPCSQATVKKIRSVGLRGGVEIAATDGMSETKST